MTVSESAGTAQAGHNSGRCSFDESARRLRENSRWLAGGVSSNFRLGIAPTPLVFERGEGACLYDVDGNRLIDYYLGMGPMILGHSPEGVRRAAAAQLDRGILYAGQTDLEAQAARKVCEMVPCAERMRFASSGSEVVQAAFRLARAATGRNTIVKFEGHYHGWNDYALKGEKPPFDNAVFPGIPEEAMRTVSVLPANDLAALDARLAGGDVAAVIMEPSGASWAMIPLEPGFLEGVRELTAKRGVVLIFDEVITGFRVALGGAAERWHVQPDLRTFGKAMAGGFSQSAIVGTARFVDMTERGFRHLGTYNGNPVAMAAIAASMQALSVPGVYERLEQVSNRLVAGMNGTFARHSVPLRAHSIGSIIGLQGSGPDYSQVRPSLEQLCARLGERGVFMLPSGRLWVSVAHTESDVDETLLHLDGAVRSVDWDCES